MKAAKARFDAHQKRLDDLKARETLNAAEALAGDIGTVFAPLGTQRGILFETWGDNEVRVIDTVDVELGELPSKTFSWQDCRHMGPDVVQAAAVLIKMAKNS